ncbi:Origin recognition complex, subunit 2 [Niveomyces insectorum RCEF 264]|uniref:Origin recognition complex, subunit 2 n=1 Tax=Niveomyces insectorum RCEF 264 TaxID=1081102 RepID=A0A162IA49_9HYPO|nr:Origin recognition complex, subunit 2 [Niveomyces insectorum RCEF 264]
MARVATRTKRSRDGATLVAAEKSKGTSTPQKDRHTLPNGSARKAPGENGVDHVETPTKNRPAQRNVDSIYDVPDDDDGENEDEREEVVEKKRGRGRPRTVVQTAESDAKEVGTPDAAATPSKRRRLDAFSTPVKALSNGVNGTPRSPYDAVGRVGGGVDTPTTRRTLADRSARRKRTRALIDQMVAEAEDDEDEVLRDTVLSDEEEDEDEDEDDEDIQDERDEDEDEEQQEEDIEKGGDAEEENQGADTVMEDVPAVATPRRRGRPPKAKTVKDVATATPQPPKRRPGRPRKDASAAVREPTPPRDLPAHEHYFFQHRPGGAAKTSNNTLAALRLLTHDEYFRLQRVTNDDDNDNDNDAGRKHHYRHRHDKEIAYLEALHAQSFAQWAFELAQGFSVCLYGYGSKQRVLRAFAAALYRGIRDHAAHKIVMVHGGADGGSGGATASASTLRVILSVLAGAVAPESDGTAPKLPGGAAAAERALFALLDDASAATLRLTIVLDGIDSPGLRRPAAQATLARLAAHRRVRLLCAADTPGFALLWDGAARSLQRFVFHDATTFRPLVSAALTTITTTTTTTTGGGGGAMTGPDTVDTVHALLGRRVRRVGGKDGAAFVLRSLPENARSLFQLLVGEVLAAGGGGGRGGGVRFRDEDGDDDDDYDDNDYGDGDVDGDGDAAAVGLEYRMLYNKAVEEFICSSEMAFRTLLKEFHDHQMVTSRKDAFGTELLSLPFRRDELEALLEELAS